MEIKEEFQRDRERVVLGGEKQGDKGRVVKSQGE